MRSLDDVAGVPPVRLGAVVRSVARYGAERVEELVRGHGRCRDPGAGLHVHGRDPDPRRAARTLPADVRLGDGSVEVDDVLGESRPEVGGQERVEERHEPAFLTCQLRARLRQAQRADVELCAAGELGKIVPRHPRRVLPPPPRVDRLGVRLHRTRKRRESIGCIRGQHVDPVHGESGERVRPEIRLRRRSAPRRGGPSRLTCGGKRSGGDR